MSTPQLEGAPARIAKRRALLLIYHRDGVEVIPLTPGTSVVVGREPPADIAIADRQLSRRHARFTLVAAEEVTVEDLGSTNGTRIGGASIQCGALKPGEEAVLGSVAVTFHIVSGDEAPELGLEGHDAFRSGVQAEMVRAKFFNRAFAVLIVRSSDLATGTMTRWCPRVRALLRPVDRAALYGAEAMEILLPEANRDQAIDMARTMVNRQRDEPALQCGIALFPGAGASAEEMLQVAWDAARRATTNQPVQLANTEGTRTLTNAAGTVDATQDLVAESPAMRSVYDTVTRLARSAIPVLLQGETGTGKEVLARLLHEAGPRSSKPMVSVNCGAIPSTLLESMLFGHERGAFTGAVQQRGVFEAADGGTVFLDEIGELPAAAQAALLRVLETKRVTRIGATKEFAVDVRIVAATHRDLEALCETGGFRSDLYYRLSTMVVEIPPLRARPDDITPLAHRFLMEASQSNDKPIRDIDAEALAMLGRYAWPGNVRELRNAIERAVVIADSGAITPRDLPARVRAAGIAPTLPSSPPATAVPSAGSLKERMERLEVDVLVQALRDAGWNQSEAARRLDMPLRTLQYKIKTFGIKKSYSAGESGRS